MVRLLLWLLLSFRVLVADDSNSDSGDSDSGGSESGGSGSGDSSVVSSSGDESGSDSGDGRRRRRARDAMLVGQDGTPDPAALSPEEYRDIPTG